MARIFPFRALRYNLSLVRVEDCVTQPYDKITPSMQASYYARSPYNLVRIILGLPELFDEPGTNDVYTRAAREFREWRASGILAQEAEPCLFAYSQRFRLPSRGDAPGEEQGEEVERRGLIALGAVSPYSEGIVFRHEQTHTRARADRLALLRATRAHFGQIFMLYSDPARSVESLLFPAPGRGTPVPEIEITDEFGVLHRLWTVSDPATINMVQGALGDKKLIIADGHHRYETALAYAEERARARSEASSEAGSGAGATRHFEGDVAPAKADRKRSYERPVVQGEMLEPAWPEAAVMMTLVNMDGENEDALAILPTHRTIRGLENFSIQRFAQSAASLFSAVDTVPVDGGDANALREALRSATEHAGSHATVLLAASGEGVLALTMDREARNRALPELPERKRQLDMVVLHELVLAKLLGIGGDAVRAGEHVSYTREIADAVAPVLRGEAQIAFLVNPVTLAQLRENTFAGEVMPQKSTDFYPKLLSGLTIYALDE